MFEAVDINLDGCSYRITKFPARKGFKLFADLGKLIGPALAELSEASGGSTDIEAASAALSGSGALSRAAKALFDGLDNPKAENLINELAGVTMFDPDGGENHRPLKPALDTHFQGRLGGMLKWLKAGLEVQFGDLADALAEVGLG
jgi:broad specificity phosphatase PhoE